MNRARVLAVVATLALSLSVAAGAASASAGRPKFLDASLAGLPVSAVNASLFGVQAGGLPWRLDAGRAKLWADGHLVVSVDGLVLDAGPAAGTNPIPHAQAIVTCAGAVAAASVVVDYSPQGNADIDDHVALPPTCLAPAVFFAGVPAPGVARWFAVTGLAR